MLVASSAPKPTSSAHAASAASAAGNKPVRRVQFNPHVSVRRLPHEHYDAACKARDGGWKEAPLDDELWDGDMAQFRPKELMPEELKRIVRAKRVSSLPKGVRKPLLRVFKVMKKWGVLEGVDMVGAHAKHLDDEPDVDDNGHNAGSGGVGGDAAGLKPLRLARKVSGSLRSPTPLSAPLDGDLEEMVTRYRSLTVLADALRGKREQEIQAENALALSKHELAVVRQRLRQLRHEIPDLEARVYRNANPRLLHYLQFDREDKVKRLQADLDRTYAEKTEAQAKVESLANLISEQTASHERIKVELSTLVEAERERRCVVSSTVADAHRLLGVRQIMDSVLSVTAPSSELALLESQVLDCIAQLNSEEALMAAVKGTRQEIEQAREGFISALVRAICAARAKPDPPRAQALLAEAGAVAMRPPAPAPSSPVRPTKRVGSVPVVTSRTPWSGNKSDMPATRSTASLEGAPEEVCLGRGQPGGLTHIQDAERLALMRQALSTRDDKINKARDLSLDSARRMTAALDVRSLPLRPLTRPAQTFPAAGRDRIPALYSSLTLTAIPDLTQPDLFGPQKRFTLSSDAQVAVQMSMRPSSGFGFGKVRWLPACRGARTDPRFACTPRAGDDGEDYSQERRGQDVQGNLHPALGRAQVGRPEHLRARARAARRRAGQAAAGLAGRAQTVHGQAVRHVRDSRPSFRGRRAPPLAPALAPGRPAHAAAGHRDPPHAPAPGAAAHHLHVGLAGVSENRAHRSGHERRAGRARRACQDGLGLVAADERHADQRWGRGVQLVVLVAADERRAHQRRGRGAQRAGLLRQRVDILRPAQRRGVVPEKRRRVWARR
jgi:hypothetical protein